MENLQIAPSIHIVIARNKHKLRRTNSNLSLKNIFFAGIKIFKGLPLSVIIIDNDKAKNSN